MLQNIFNFLPRYKYVILCGDLNARFGSGTDETSNIEESLKMCNLTVVPHKATFHFNCASILDVIASNLHDRLVEYDQVSAPAFSAHDLICAVYDLSTPVSEKQVIAYRDWSKIDVDELQREVSCAPWHLVFNSNNIDDKVNNFNVLVSELMDKFVPVNFFKVKHKGTPWMNKGILKLISKRNGAWGKYKNNKSDTSFNIYKSLRNKVKQAIRNAKIKYYHEIFGSNSSKDIWNSIRSLGP